MKKQLGFLMMLAVVIILIVSFLGLAASVMFTASLRASTNQLKSTQAFYLAESALEYGTHKVLEPTLSSRTTCTASSTSNNDFGGVFLLTPSGPFYATTFSTLNGSLNAIDTTIPLVSTAAYQSYGRVMIDRELINYTGISGNNLIGATRGVDGSTATSHASGTPVGQYQCNFAGQAGVPDLGVGSSGDPGGKRFVQDAVQLQEGWAVGVAVPNIFNFARWNRPTEVVWNNAAVNVAPLSSGTLNSVSTLSYADAWAVGNAVSSNLNIRHWNGTTWAASPGVPAGIASQLTNIYCLSANDCWTVGQATGGNLLMLQWDGTSWTRLLPPQIPSLNIALHSVTCVSTNDCWATGNPIGNPPGNPPLYTVILRWDGTNWTRLTTPTVPSLNAALNSVTCISTNDCWAVGSQVSSNMLIEHWDGTNWTRVLPAVAINVQLNEVTCNSTNDCWAVGQANGGNLMIERWDGTNWSRVLPAAAVNQNLFGVDCVKRDDCWAVGGNTTVEHWDGTSWTQAATPGGFGGATLNFVSMVKGPRTKPQAAWQEAFP